MNMGMASSEQLSNAAQEKITVELADLDWEDRERILRLLFSKMNTGENANNWRDGADTTQNRGESSQQATGVNQSFREQQVEDEYDDENDANVFDATKIPNDYGHERNNDDSNNNQYYEESNNSEKQ